MAEKNQPNPTPMRYRVEFYDGGVSDEDLINSYEPSGAPYTFSVGDIVNPFGWGGKNRLSGGGLYKIVAIEHQLTLVENPESTEGEHNIVISLEAITVQGTGTA